MTVRQPTQRVDASVLARVAGVLYLVNILAGAFAIGVVPALLSGADPAATARHVRAHELLYRSGLVAHVLVTLTNVAMAVIFYDLFRVVSRRLAQLDLCLILVATAVEAASLFNQLAALTLLGGGHATDGLTTNQRQALAAVSADVSTASYDIYTVFFGLDLVLLGYLIHRSNFLPRTIGVLVAVDGVAYLVYGFADLLVPGAAQHLVPWIQLPAPLGEGSLSLWLTVAGVNVQRWRRAASVTAGRYPATTGGP
jgi:hypothetical protein